MKSLLLCNPYAPKSKAQVYHEIRDINWGKIPQSIMVQYSRLRLRSHMVCAKTCPSLLVCFSAFSLCQPVCLDMKTCYCFCEQSLPGRASSLASFLIFINRTYLLPLELYFFFCSVFSIQPTHGLLYVPMLLGSIALH